MAVIPAQRERAVTVLVVWGFFRFDFLCVCVERSRSGDGHLECRFFEHPQVTSVVCVLTRVEWQEPFLSLGMCYKGTAREWVIDANC